MQLCVLILYICWDGFVLHVIPYITIVNTIPFNIFLLDMYFDKSIVGSQFFLITFMLAKFQDDQRLINI